MHAKKAKKIIKDNHLISGKLSQTILKQIINNELIDFDNFPKSLDKEKILHLKDLYQTEVSKIGDIKQKPRNYPFYLLAKKLVVGFDYKKIIDQYQIFAPRVHNLRPSLLSLLLGLIDYNKDSWLHRQSDLFDELPDTIVCSLADSFQQEHIFIPDTVSVQAFIDWIKKGIGGEVLNIIMSICPDYGVIETGDPLLPYQYTFHNLGENIGLVGQRAISITNSLHHLFSKLNIPIKITLAMADFEAFDDNILRSLHLSEQEFLQRVGKSKEAIKNSCPCASDVTLFTELCGGKSVWKTYQIQMKNKMYANDYGNAGLNEKILDRILQARKPLYHRWLGRESSDLECLNLLLKQGTDYATKGMVISKHFLNGMVIGLDQAVMAPFLNIYQVLPTLYLKPYYQ